MEPVNSPSVPLRVSAVQQTIARHRQMVEFDEACFDETGIAHDEQIAANAREVEIAAFRAFCTLPCQDDNDVQAKVRYVIDGTVGQRDTLMSCLLDEEYGGIETQAAFLRSLQTKGATE